MAVVRITSAVNASTAAKPSGPGPIGVIDKTYDPARQSWVDGANGYREFPVQNLPLGVFSFADRPAQIGCAVGDQILHLAAASQAGLLPASLADALLDVTLNSLFARPAPVRRSLRRAIFRHRPKTRCSLRPTPT